jgi:hypothetical protein
MPSLMGQEDRLRLPGCVRVWWFVALVDVLSAAGRVRLVAAGAHDPGFVGQHDRSDPVAHVRTSAWSSEISTLTVMRERRLRGEGARAERTPHGSGARGARLVERYALHERREPSLENAVGHEVDTGGQVDRVAKGLSLAREPGLPHSVDHRCDLAETEARAGAACLIVFVSASCTIR